MVVAKKRSALTQLQALMREDGAGLRKRYLALLPGRLPDGVMSVDAPLNVGLRQGGERHVQVHDGGKASLSHFRALARSEEHTSELQSLMRISYAVFCLKNKTPTTNNKPI